MSDAAPDEPPRPPLHRAPEAWKQSIQEHNAAASKFTEPRKNLVLASLQTGHSEESAAALAGVSITTLRKWLRRGAEDNDTGIESPFATFHDQYVQAIATAEHRALKVVKDKIEAPGPEQLKAATWFLERRHSRTWAKNDRVDVNHNQDGTVVIQLAWPGTQPVVVDQAALEAGSDDEIVDAEVVEDALDVGDGPSE